MQCIKLREHYMKAYNTFIQTTCYLNSKHLQTEHVICNVLSSLNDDGDNKWKKNTDHCC